ncbi:TetR/AcrR family transcriptional regulator [Pleurocapsales cyanobacterium LEGE 10410]|nr:TetR/AcrR family transcriptional regulator [Pleurocapsales cyanobacterium LEGE 10410]
MSKEQVIPKLIPVFRHYGYEGATVSRLSDATGLKKASLYHHFQGGKEQMAAAVLEYVANWLDENVFTPLQSDKPPSERIRAMSQGLDKFYDSGQDPCLLSVMSVGEADNLFHQQLEQSLNHWLALLTQVIEETGVEPELARQRAEDALMMIQGALVLVRVNNDTQPFKRAIAKLPQILLDD